MDAFILSLDKTEKYSNRRVVFMTIYIKAINFDGGTTLLIILFLLLLWWRYNRKSQTTTSSGGLLYA